MVQREAEAERGASKHARNMKKVKIRLIYNEQFHLRMLSSWKDNKLD